MALHPRSRLGSIVIAGLFLTLFGFLWYGVLFRDLQMKAHGYGPADYAGNSPMWYAGGLVISILIAGGLSLMVRRGEKQGFQAGLKAGIHAALGFGIPLVGYPFVFSPHHELGLFVAGVAHIVIGWSIAAGFIGAVAGPPRSEAGRIAPLETGLAETMQG